MVFRSRDNGQPGRYSPEPDSAIRLQPRGRNYFFSISPPPPARVWCTRRNDSDASTIERPRFFSPSAPRERPGNAPPLLFALIYFSRPLSEGRAAATCSRINFSEISRAQRTHLPGNHRAALLRPGGRNNRFVYPSRTRGIRRRTRVRAQTQRSRSPTRPTAKSVVRVRVDDDDRKQ